MLVNELSQDRILRPAIGDHEFGLFFASYLQGLFIAETQGVPINAPASAIDYARRFNEETLRRLAITRPFSRRRSLTAEAEKFRRCLGWRGRFHRLASACALALEALAAEHVRGVGNPRKHRGATQYIERRYVNDAFHCLAEHALSRGRLDKAWVLYAADDQDGKVRRLRKNIAAAIVRRMEQDDELPNKQRVRTQIREHIKTVQLPTNVFAAWKALGDLSIEKLRPRQLHPDGSTVGQGGRSRAPKAPAGSSGQ